MPSRLVSPKQVFRGALGLVLAAALAWLVFRDTDWAEVGRAIREVDLGWILLGQVFLWGSYFARAHRFGFVVRAASPASYRALLSSTQIGFLVNFTVPARVGELVRALVMTRLAAVPLARALAMVAVDRVADVVGLLVVVLVAALALAADAHVEIPVGSVGNTEPISISAGLIRGAGGALAVAALGLLAALALLYAQRDRALTLARLLLSPVPSWMRERTMGVMESFAEGLAVFRSAGGLWRTLFWSLVIWGANVAALAAILDAFGIAYPWYTPFLMLGLVAVFVAVPVTPGVVGQFHLPAVAALLMAAPETPQGVAKAFAIVTHLCTLFPVAGLGIYCLLRERIGLLTVVREGQDVEEDQAGGRGPSPAAMR